MRFLLVIAAGGSVGAVFRYLVANGIYDWLGRSFPHGTLFVNVSGSFLMGVLTELMLQRIPASAEFRAAVLIGFLGAYTTFSTFAIETLSLLEAGDILKALLNVFLSTVLCLAAVWIGLVVGRQMFGADLAPGFSFSFSSLFAVLAAGFVLAACAELLVHALHLKAVHRHAALVVILGVIAATSSVWAVLKADEASPGLHGVLGIFIAYAVAAVLAVWLGASTGEWLWNVRKSG